MTAQIGDKFNFKGSEYTMVSITTPIKFNPEIYGITPQSIMTACWKGFWCVYDISDEEIVLRDLYVSSKDDFYPEIKSVTPLSEDKNSKKRFKYMGHHLYKDLNIPIEYTGKILVGNDFIHEYYIHMGFQRTWAYKALKELIFEEGILLDVIDHSDMAAKLRKEIEVNPKEFNERLRENIPQFVDESFSTDMSIKAWWIK